MINIPSGTDLVFEPPALEFYAIFTLSISSILEL